ncbi:MAG: hypothetical protein ABI630_05500 [Betaproteobacteria bacterium]
MLNLVEAVGGWLVRTALMFVLVSALLVAGYWMQDEVRAYRRLQGEVALLTQGKAGIEQQVREFEQAAAARVKALAQAPAAALDARIATIVQEISRLALEQKDGIGFFTSVPLGRGVVDHFKRNVEIEVLTQERDYLLRLRPFLAATHEGPAQLEAFRRIHAAAYADYLANQEAQRVLAENHPIATLIIGTDLHARLRKLRQDAVALIEKNRRADADYRFKKQVIDAAAAARKPFELSSERVAAVLQPLDALIGEREKSRLGNLAGRALERWREVWPTAAAIVLSILLVPIGIKLLFFFVLAPLVARRPPTSVMPGTSGTIDLALRGSDADAARPAFSAVSQPIAIDAGQVLLIHPQYLQSMPSATQPGAQGETRSDTKLLLDWSYPLSSLAAGLLMLTRVRAAKRETVVVSSTTDPINEIGVLGVPEGSAVVFQPRNLVGVVCAEDKPLRITRHWRLGSLHAWMTLQLRYLVFHGPVSLIAKGGRGIRVEKAEAGRAINQEATIGFSANVLYSTARSETFLAYALGQQPLFKDRFAGDAGFYVYEEMPGFGRKSGIAGRGLEGFTDSLMKIFGL